MKTLRDLYEALSEIPDHWLDTGISFCLNDAELSTRAPFTLRLAGNIAEVSISDPEAHALWNDCDLDSHADDKVRDREEELREEEQTLLLVAEGVVSSYEDRDEILRNIDTELGDGAYNALLRGFREPTLDAMLETLCAFGSEGQVCVRAFLWAQRASNEKNTHG